VKARGVYSVEGVSEYVSKMRASCTVHRAPCLCVVWVGGETLTVPPHHRDDGVANEVCRRATSLPPYLATYLLTFYVPTYLPIAAQELSRLAHASVVALAKRATLEFKQAG
jgi:hypothetical protein